LIKVCQAFILAGCGSQAGFNARMMEKPDGPRTKKPLRLVPLIVLAVLAGELLAIILSVIWFMLERD